MRHRLAHAAQQWLPTWLAQYRASHLLRKHGSFLHATGYLRSLEKLEPRDAQGNPLPFLNYAVIDLLQRRIDKSLNVFEFGSGYSTLFFARIANTVTSVEHDAHWYEEVTRLAAPFENVKLLLRPLGESYSGAILETGSRYDLVLVDGRMRTRCAERALSVLSESGVILWDDSARERYADGMKALQDAGFRRLPIIGLKPAGFGSDESSFFYRPGNCLGF